MFLGEDAMRLSCTSEHNDAVEEHNKTQSTDPNSRTDTRERRFSESMKRQGFVDILTGQKDPTINT